MAPTRGFGIFVLALPFALALALPLALGSIGEVEAPPPPTRNSGEEGDAGGKGGEVAPTLAFADAFAEDGDEAFGGNGLVALPSAGAFDEDGFEAGGRSLPLGSGSSSESSRGGNGRNDPGPSENSEKC